LINKPGVECERKEETSKVQEEKPHSELFVGQRGDEMGACTEVEPVVCGKTSQHAVSHSQA
jgi:hypothetical protein